MPCDYWTYAAENVVVKRYVGRITHRCVLDLLDRMELDPDYVEGMSEFDDLRHVTELAVTDQEVIWFADLIKGFSHRSRTPMRKAVLTASEQTRAAAELFRTEVETVPGLEVAIFADIEQALAFLGIDGLPLGDRLRTERLFVH
ncbi:hypothetical protein GE300_00500 [Rhodobacteraceae bacterium 2CG4]|uniref:SpoIIAA-like protein n=1 Tax=Halovulum marinum TaxID=2662447 RepID=A0A6L5YUX8_9RHOB|nr:hypothetical protein [Halovulum marinum]MSU88091.1 hypothetical protein [Halovulum marinum]